jgi:hypothetical protein
MDRITFNKALGHHLWKNDRTASELSELAEAFRMTGNRAISDALFNYSQQIKETSAAIRDAWGEQVKFELAESQKGIGRTMEVILSRFPKEGEGDSDRDD